MKPSDLIQCKGHVLIFKTPGKDAYLYCQFESDASKAYGAIMEIMEMYSQAQQPPDPEGVMP